jgi:hypothetical protein
VFSAELWGPEKVHRLFNRNPVFYNSTRTIPRVFVLENYTFLTLRASVLRINVYAGRKRLIVKRFSNTAS